MTLVEAACFILLASVIMDQLFPPARMPAIPIRSPPAARCVWRVPVTSKSACYSTSVPCIGPPHVRPTEVRIATVSICFGFIDRSRSEIRLEPDGSCCPTVIQVVIAVRDRVLRIAIRISLLAPTSALRDILRCGPTAHGIRTEMVEMVEKMAGFGENRVKAPFLKCHAAKSLVTIPKCPACGSM